MKNILIIIERGYTVLFLFLYSGGLLFLILSGGANQEQLSDKPDYLIMRLIFLFNYLISLFLIIVRWKKTFYLLSRDKVVWVLVLIAIVSALWSVDPEATIRRSTALAGTTIFGIYIATNYSLRQQLQLMSWTFGITIILSFIFAIVLPQYGIMGGLHAGSWRGIYTHKNVLGKMMVLSSSIFLLLSMSTKRNRWLLQLGLMASILLILLSTSKTSLLNLFVTFSAFLIFQTLRWRYKIKTTVWALLLLVGSATCGLFLLSLSELVNLLGRDLTFSGRNVLWAAVWDLIQQHPWLGYGYGASWKDWNSETSYVWKFVGGWKAPNSHNGLLDLLLDLGFLGAITFLIGFLINLVKSINLASSSETADDYWPLLFLTYLIQANISETSLFLQNNIFWIIYVTVSLTLLKSSCIGSRISQTY